jgi:hypothetical protein
MFSVVLRKARTLADTVHDFYSEPLASFRGLKQGLAERPSPIVPEVLDRVLAAYRAAKRDQQSAAGEYQPSGEWAALIETKSKLFQDRDSTARVLQSFFRNEHAFFGLNDYALASRLKPRRKWLTRILFVNAMLRDYRVWSQLTDEQLAVIDAPSVGNPFGYCIDGILVTPAVFRHHSMARKAVGLANGAGVLLEIGGGFGNIGMFALRSSPIHYVDLDLPEILLLASYWLCALFPDRSIVLYGEQDRDAVLSHLENYDAVLFPNFCLPRLPNEAADVVLNTRSLSEMSQETIEEYTNQIARVCRSYFLHENSDRAHHSLGHTELPASSFPIKGFRLLNKAISPWGAGGGRYREFLYQKLEPGKI